MDKKWEELTALVSSNPLFALPNLTKIANSYKERHLQCWIKNNYNDATDIVFGYDAHTEEVYLLSLNSKDNRILFMDDHAILLDAQCRIQLHRDETFVILPDNAPISCMPDVITTKKLLDVLEIAESRSDVFWIHLTGYFMVMMAYKKTFDRYLRSLIWMHLKRL